MMSIINTKVIQKASKIAYFAMFLSFILLFVEIFFIYNTKDDFQQLNAVKMMFLHVPFSWISILLFCSTFILNLISYIFKLRIFTIIAFAVAKIGANVCFLSLITGMIWGKMIWGVYWVWDARLTSMFFLFVLYLAYNLIYQINKNNLKVDVILVVFSSIGFLNVFLIKIATKYWNTLHQSATFTFGKNNNIDLEFSNLVFVSSGIFLLLFGSLIAIETETQIQKIKLK